MRHEEVLDGIVVDGDKKRQRDMIEAYCKFSERLEPVDGSVKQNANIAMVYSGALKMLGYIGVQFGFAGFTEKQRDSFLQTLFSDIADDVNESFEVGVQFKLDKEK